MPSFPAIGNSSNPFTGSLDGQNHAIIGLNINSTIDGSYSDSNVALFGKLSYATVKNLFFLDANVFVSGQICCSSTQYCNVGILAGRTIMNLFYLLMFPINLFSFLFSSLIFSFPTGCAEYSTVESVHVGTSSKQTNNYISTDGFYYFQK